MDAVETPASASQGARVSVALCTYQGQSYLEEQLESIFQQTHPPDELIVCDDASTDRTIDIVREFKSRATFSVRIHVNDEQLGYTKNFEKAIRLCQGDFIFLADQDDVWAVQKLSVQIRRLVASPGDGAVFSDGEIVDERLVPLGSSLWATYGFDEPLQRRFRGGGALDVLCKRNVVSGMTLGFSSRFRGLILPIPADWFHDHWISVLIAATAGVAMVPQPLVKYRQHERQALGTATAPGRANKQGFQQKLEDRRKTASAASLLRLANRHGQVHERLKARSDDYHPSPQALADLQGRINHFRARAEMRKGRGRLRLLIKEALSRNYQRYSGGWKSMALDLILS